MDHFCILSVEMSGSTKTHTAVIRMQTAEGCYNLMYDALMEGFTDRFGRVTDTVVTFWSCQPNRF